MSELTLRHYKAIAQIAAQKNMTLAAQKLCVSVAAVSKSLSEAEGLIGFKLFQRNSKQVILTERGALMMAHINELLLQHQKVMQYAKSVKENIRQPLRITGTQMLNATYLPSVLSEVAASYRDFDLRLIENNEENIQDKLEGGYFDMVIGPRRSLSSKKLNQDIECLDIFEIPVNLYTAVDHIKDRQSIRWAELEQERVILFDSRAYAQLKAYSGYDLQLREIEISNNLTSSLAMVEDKSASLISALYVRKIIKAYEVSEVAIVEPQIRIMICLYLKKQTAQQIPAGLIELLTNALRDKVGRSVPITAVAGGAG